MSLPGWNEQRLSIAVLGRPTASHALESFIAEAHAVTIALLGQVPALMMLVSTFLGLVIGPLADRYGYRRTLLVCLLAVAAGSVATGLAPALPVLVLAALLGRKAVSRIQSGGPLAATLGIPLLTAIAAALDWRGAFIALSGLALAVTLTLWKTLCRDERRRLPRECRRQRDVDLLRRLLRAAVWL